MDEKSRFPIENGWFIEMVIMENPSINGQMWENVDLAMKNGSTNGDLPMTP